MIVTIPASKFAQLKIVVDDEYSYLTKFGTIEEKLEKKRLITLTNISLLMNM